MLTGPLTRYFKPLNQLSSIAVSLEPRRGDGRLRLATRRRDLHPSCPDEQPGDRLGLGASVVWLVLSGYLVFYLVEQKVLGDAPYPFDEDELQRCDIGQKLERANQTREAKRRELARR